MRPMQAICIVEADCIYISALYICSQAVWLLISPLRWLITGWLIFSSLSGRYFHAGLTAFFDWLLLFSRLRIFLFAFTLIDIIDYWCLRYFFAPAPPPFRLSLCFFFRATVFAAKSLFGWLSFRFASHFRVFFLSLFVFPSLFFYFFHFHFSVVFFFSLFCHIDFLSFRRKSHFLLTDIFEFAPFSLPFFLFACSDGVYFLFRYMFLSSIHILWCRAFTVSWFSLSLTFLPFSFRFRLFVSLRLFHWLLTLRQDYWWLLIFITDIDFEYVSAEIT